MLTQQELGQRLKRAREAAGRTQEEVAQQVELSRVAISQIESGQRTVSSLELKHLATLYGRDIASFLEDQPVEQDALATLFRAHPDIIENGNFNDPLRKAMDLFREYMNLKQLLNEEEEQSVPPAYSYGEPRTVWEAIQMGERVAEEERSRLELGIDPIRDMAELVESQGIPVIEIALEDQISGIFMADPEAQLCIFINQYHLLQVKARAAFTIAHEYGHILLDRDKVSAISKTMNEHDLHEVRANAFAAAILMPEEGLRQFLRSIGKGESSREKLLAYSAQSDPIIGHHRRLASSQVITLYDIVKLYTYFGTSFEAALYRLKNLKFLSEEIFDQLYPRKEEARQISQHLNIAEEERAQHISNFKLNFTGMVIEAYRREQITYAKLIKLAEKVNFDSGVIDKVLACMGLEEDPEEKVYLPE